MKRDSRWLALVLVAATSFAHAAGPLSAAQVEKATGLQGLRAVTGKYDKGGFSIVDANKQIVVSVKDQPASVYEVWKQGGGQPVAKLGDEAFLTKTGPVASVCFKKAGHGVCVVGATAATPGSVAVTEAQLMELARTAASGL